MGQSASALSQEADAAPPRLSPWAALTLTLAAGGIGLLTDRAAEAAGWTFPSWGYLVGEVIWKAATIGVLLWGIKRVTREPVSTATLSIRPGVKSREPYPVVWALAIAGAAIAASSLIGSSATSSSSYGQVHHVGLALGLGELLVRYPVTVASEELLFRGWMQPRLGRNGPVLSALLWSLYHLQQAATIPSLILFGLGLGLLRWWTGNVRLSGTLHYISNAAFFISTYT